MGGEDKWCVVTGGRGFAARHLVAMLIKYGMFSVRIADLGPTIKLDEDEENGILGEALKSGRAEYVSADLRDKAQVVGVCVGVEVVFHMAAPDSSINNHRLHYSVNVQGTQNVIDACYKLNIKRLIYTSSPSVVFDGVHGISNGNESLPYPPKHNDSYSATKAEGEALVIKSNGTNGLLTCCIRPSSIFGPGDKLLVPSLVSAARSGKSKFIIGDGNNMYDFTYVENVAHAHICAERALASEGAVADKAAGQAYFITNGEQIKFWEFISLILEGLGYERPKIKIPAFVMMPIAHMVELTYKVLAPYGMKVPQLIPSRIRLLSLSRTFDCSKANELLGYSPIVPLQEGIRRTIDSYQHLRADARSERKGPSKAELLLGRGKVADTLLWRDKKQTLTVLVTLAAFYFNFVATGFTLITSVSKLLLVASVFLFVHGKLPQNILGYKIEKIPESKFHVSEAVSHHVALSVASGWNSAVSDLKSLCKGNDTILFVKVVLSLLLLSILGAVSLHNVFVIGLPIIFVSFVMLGRLQEASSYIANSTKKHKEKRLVGGSGLKDDYEAIDFEKPRVSSDKRSMDCYDELREVIRESFARQNLLSAKERNSDLDRKDLDLCVDLPSSSSSHSSMICSHSSGCSPSPSSKKKGPNLIAKLMGLEEVPSKVGNGGEIKKMEKERIPYRISPLLDIDLPRLKKPQFMAQKVVREKRTLEEIIETMQFKGILGSDSVDRSNDCRYRSNPSFLRSNLTDGPPIVLMRPLRDRGGEPHDDHWINEELIKSRQMQRKMRVEFPPRAKLKTKETNEKSTPNQKLEKGKEGKNLVRVGVRPVKKTVDSQDRLSMSTTKMNHSKPLVPQMQKKDAEFNKFDKIPKAAANTRKLPETKDAKPKPQRCDKTQVLAKPTTLNNGRTVRENNVSKSQIAREKVAAAERNMKPTSLNPTVPKKSPRKGEPKRKLSSAIVENIQSDDNSARNIETNIEESLVKNTEAEQCTEEVSTASYMSDTENSGNAATLPRTMDDLNHIEDVQSIPSCNSDQIKGSISITNTRHFLLSSVSFLNQVEELFDTGTHDFTNFQTSRLSDGEVLHDSLLLDCAKEILERKCVQYRRKRNSWSQRLMRRPKCHLSMEQLVEEICVCIEDLQNYSSSCGDVVLADSIYPMLERDLQWNEEVTGGWDSGWRNGYTTEAVDDEVMHAVEELFLSEIVGDVIIEIM